MEIVRTSGTSRAGTEHFFARWADMATWPEWNADTEWVRLDGPFGTGATGKLKPKGGPVVPFTVTELTAGSFVDESRLLGARLVFDHRIEASDGVTRLRVVVTLTGPLARVWNLILGKGIRESAQRDLDALIAVAEREGAPA